MQRGFPQSAEWLVSVATEDELQCCGGESCCACCLQLPEGRVLRSSNATQAAAGGRPVHSLRGIRLDRKVVLFPATLPSTRPDFTSVLRAEAPTTIRLRALDATMEGA